MKHILITGCNGQLGNEMHDYAMAHGEEFAAKDVQLFYTDVAELDITNLDAVQAFVQAHQIDVIVNCAAYTNVDKAEDDEQTAYLINAKAVENLGKSGARVIHISTDYVFDGTAHLPYTEDQTACPNTAYGRTKRAGEELLLATCPEAIIIRTAWLYSAYGNNFVKTMLRLGQERDSLNVVFDQIGTPTYAADLAAAIFGFLQADKWYAGIYHFSNEGVCSWYDFTCEIHRQAGITCNVQPILSAAYPSKTPRPHYSVLDKSKLKQRLGVTIPHWTEALSRCLKRLNAEC